HYPHLLQGFYQTSHLLIGVLAEAGESFYLPGGEFFLLGSLGIPGRDFVGTLGQFRFRRYNSHPFLAREDLLVERIPTLIELTLVSLDVFLGHMMRRVQSTGGKVDEE